MSSNPPSGSWNPNDPGYGSGSDPTRMPGPGQPYGQPGYGQQYEQPQQPQPGYGGGPYGPPPGGGYGGPPSGGSSSGGRSPVVPFLAGVLATLVIVGAGLGVLFATGGGIVGDRDRGSSSASDGTPSGGDTDGSSPEPATSDSITPSEPETDEITPSEVTPTESESFDALSSACEGGDFPSCDQLYFDTPIGSDEEQFGSTCGGRIAETQGYCEEWSSYTRPATGTADFDRAFDRLWGQCEQGSLDSCDQLYLGSPIGSTYEAFGSTCAGRTSETDGDCTEAIDYL